MCVTQLAKGVFLFLLHSDADKNRHQHNLNHFPDALNKGKTIKH